MLISYGNFALSFAIDSTHHNASFLTSNTVMNDGRSGVLCSIKWDQGTPAATDYVTITVTVVDPLDSTAALGAVGLINVQGVPAGLHCVVNSVTQGLVAGARGELSAWWIPQITNNSFIIALYNTTTGSDHPIASGATIGIGEIFAGRVTSLPTLAGQVFPSLELQDPTQAKRSDGGQLWPIMRKPYRQCSQTLGYKTITDVAGGSSSSIPSGSNPASNIDIRTLQELLSTTAVCAVCPIPQIGGAAAVGGLKYNQAFMQPNWMLARPSSIGTVSMDQPPLWSWNPVFMEAI